MGKNQHGSLDGFSPVRDEKGTIKKALCLNCNRELTRRDALALETHKKVCKGQSTATPSPQSTPQKNRDRSPIFGSPRNKENEQMNKNSTNAVNEVRTTPKKILPVDEAKPFDKDKVDVLFLNFLLFCDVKLQKINSKHCKKFLNALNQSYEIPDSCEMKNKILAKAYETMITENSTDKFLNTIGVIIHEKNNEKYGISVAIHANEDYVYISYKKVDTYEIDDFVRTSVIKAKSIFNIQVKYVLFEGPDVITDSSGSVDGCKYYILKSFTSIIKTLRHQHLPFSVQTDEDIKQSISYNEALDDFLEHLYQLKYPLASAVEKLFSLLENGKLDINSRAATDILDFINPICLAANYLNPSYKGHFFIEHKSLTDIMHEFLFDEAPQEIFVGLSHYMNGTQKFKLLLDPSKSYNQERFWHIVAMDYPQLSSYAMNLLEIPGSIKKIEEENLEKIITASQSDNSETSTALLITLLLNE